MADELERPIVEHGPVCPLDVPKPIMLHRWDRLAFLHWSFEPAVVQRLLPSWLTVEPWEGRAWVGLVPFFMEVSTGGGINGHWASNFLETNVRTYVRDPDGRVGIWFFSLDAARLGAVMVARATYRLPYFWSHLELDLAPDEVRYECRRRWPGPRGARSLAHLRLGDPYAPDELTTFDHYLTARWTLFASVGEKRQRYADAWHDPWVLRRAEAIEVDDELLTAAGLPRPTDAPIVHWSEGVAVRIGRPQKYR